MNTPNPHTGPAALTMASIREAHERIKDKIHRTPVMTSEVLDARAGRRLYFKCENLQKVGAFKARGATNAVFLLTDEEAVRGVVTHSSGNHAAALARAAKLRGIPAYIVMPNNAPRAKQEAVRRYGGDIVLCEPTLAARESTARQVMERTGAAFIHPYDDLRVMAGQGTTAIELLEDVSASSPPERTMRRDPSRKAASFPSASRERSPMDSRLRWARGRLPKFHAWSMTS
jgi:threonine dehydratase